MANEQPVTRGTLGLTGLTMNAMALIAPGAFLWLTFQMQSLYGAPLAGQSMWFGILFALLLCLATAIAAPSCRNFIRARVHPTCTRSRPIFRRRTRTVRPHSEIHNRIGDPPVLLGLSRRHGRRDGHPGRVPAGAVLPRHFQQQL